VVVEKQLMKPSPYLFRFSGLASQSGCGVDDEELSPLS